MPLATPTTKPVPWPWSASSVPSEWQSFAAKLVRAYPFWEGSGSSLREIVSGTDSAIAGADWVSTGYRTALDFDSTTSDAVQTPGFDPPSRGMCVILLKPEQGGTTRTPVHGATEFEFRLSAGDRVLHRFFYGQFRGTAYTNVAVGTYTMAGLGWDLATGNGPIYRDGTLIETQTGHIVDPGALSEMFIGSAGPDGFPFGGVIEEVLILSDWPTQAEWDMLASDPFGWARQAESSAGVDSELSGSALFSLAASATLRVGAALSGASLIEKRGTGVLRVAHSLSGSAVLTSTASGSLRTAHALSGRASLSTHGSGSLGAAAALSGTPTVSVTGSGVLRVGRALSGVARVQIAASGSLSVGASLSGASSLSVWGSGVLAEPETRYEYTTMTSLTATASLATSYPPAPLAGMAAVALSGRGALTRGAPLAGYASIRLRTDVALGTEYALSTRRVAGWR